MKYDLQNTISVFLLKNFMFYSVLHQKIGLWFIIFTQNLLVYNFKDNTLN